MKRKISLIIYIIFLILALSGCGLYNLSNFILPNDLEFLALVESLDTPQKIAKYMEDNFIYKKSYSVKSPYEFWKTKKGDCDEYSAFGTYIARQHNYEAYQVYIWYSNENDHVNAVYKEGNYWTLIDCWIYHTFFLSIEDAILWHSNYANRNLIKYKIMR